MTEPSTLLASLSLHVRHYSDGCTYASIAGEEHGELWTAILPSWQGQAANLTVVIDSIARVLVGWAEIGPLGVEQVIDAISV